MSKNLVGVILLLSVVGSASAQAASVSRGNFGETLSIPIAKFSKDQSITVTGKGFDESVGIYLAFCVVPKKGALPTPCGGGVNKSGMRDSSYWISSNPPPYGKGLAMPFQAGGRFIQKLDISKRIGAFDCRKVKCGVTVRSDHLHEGDRTHDIIIPVTFTA